MNILKNIASKIGMDKSIQNGIMIYQIHLYTLCQNLFRIRKYVRSVLSIGEDGYVYGCGNV